MYNIQQYVNRGPAQGFHVTGLEWPTNPYYMPCQAPYV